MKTIWKTELEFTHNYQELWMPTDAQILTVKEQRGRPCIWYAVDTHAFPIKRTFIMVGTGHEMPDVPDRDITYLGTMFFKDDLLYHIFELENPV